MFGIYKISHNKICAEIVRLHRPTKMLVVAGGPKQLANIGGIQFEIICIFSISIFAYMLLHLCVC